MSGSDDIKIQKQTVSTGQDIPLVGGMSCPSGLGLRTIRTNLRFVRGVREYL